MKRLCALVFFFIPSSLLFAQKPPLDFMVQDGWPIIGNERISNDGKYIIYNISSTAAGTKLIAQATSDTWKMEIPGASDAGITEDSKTVVFKNEQDSLGIIKLGSNKVTLLNKVRTYKTSHAGIRNWLAYQLANKDLILMDVTTGQQIKYLQVNFYEFSNSGEVLVMQQASANESSEESTVRWIHLNDLSSSLIWSGYGGGRLAMNISGTEIAFLAGNRTNLQNINQLWYYKTGMDSAKVLVDHSTQGMEGFGLSPSDVLFSPDGNNIFFKIHRLLNKIIPKSRDSANHLVVWSYHDKTLNDRPIIMPVSPSFSAAINLENTKRIISLTKNDDDYFPYSIYNDMANKIYSKNKVIVFENSIGRLDEYKWRSSARPDMYLISTIDGSGKLLKKNLSSPLDGTYGFSPRGKFIIWYDRRAGHWFTYNTSLGISKNITKKIPYHLANNYAEEAGFPTDEGLAGWLENDSSVLIYDNYDIWQVDPNGVKTPVNVTHGYGRKNNIRLRCLDNGYNISGLYSISDTLLLSAFNEVTKYHGFLKVGLNEKHSMIKYPMFSMILYGEWGRQTPAYSSDTYFQFALKAKRTNTYIFKPTLDTLFPNLVVTNDFVHFKPLTHLAPQNAYNWYTNELVHWKLPDGDTEEGILFKPEDFDPNKKYPLIIYIYEKFSDALNVFIKPDLASGVLNIPWYVSNGYLVFVPDIHYKPGFPGESAYRTVVSAAAYLRKFSWVAPLKLGLQGHSFGGWETNYIVTRTHLFAAAASSAGLSDLVSESGQLAGETGYQFIYETGQMRIGSTLWERPELYIENSPIFKADRVTTPLLVNHNTMDIGVHFSQGEEWFTALRRLGKKAWMLQYTDEGHNIESEKNELDYSIRLSQFFDHYLKNAPPPKWMTTGVNGIDNDLELDTSGKQP